MPAKCTFKRYGGAIFYSAAALFFTRLVQMGLRPSQRSTDDDRCFKLKNEFVVLAVSIACRTFKESKEKNLKQERLEMKSIFNVFHLTSPNSLHSAETILNKLIFNERLSCALKRKRLRRKNKLDVVWNSNGLRFLHCAVLLTHYVYVVCLCRFEPEARVEDPYKFSHKLF